MQPGETRIHRIRLDPFVRLEALADRDDPVDRQQAVQRPIVEFGAGDKRDGIVRTSRDHATQHGREVGFERWCGDTPDCCVRRIAPCTLLKRCRDVIAIELATPPIGELPDAFPTLRRLLEARMGKSGKREYVQVLRLLETFDLEALHGAVKDALRLGAIGYDAVKHLVLCRIERRPPKLDLDDYPYLPRANVATTATASYMSLLGGGAS